MDEKTDQQFIASLDMTDEMRIQLAIDEFYEFTKGFDGDTDKIVRMKLIRNNIINMVHTYLKKYNNELIMKEFYERLKKAKQNAIRDNKIHKYEQFMNEIRVVQEYKGIQENIAEKLGEQLFEMFKNSEVIDNGRTATNDTNI